MDRRRFVKLLGLTPLAGLVAQEAPATVVNETTPPDIVTPEGEKVILDRITTHMLVDLNLDDCEDWVLEQHVAHQPHVWDQRKDERIVTHLSIRAVMPGLLFEQANAYHHGHRVRVHSERNHVDLQCHVQGFDLNTKDNETTVHLVHWGQRA